MSLTITADATASSVISNMTVTDGAIEDIHEQPDCGAGSDHSGRTLAFNVPTLPAGAEILSMALSLTWAKYATVNNGSVASVGMYLRKLGKAIDDDPSASGSAYNTAVNLDTYFASAAEGSHTLTVTFSDIRTLFGSYPEVSGGQIKLYVWHRLYRQSAWGDGTFEGTCQVTATLTVTYNGGATTATVQAEPPVGTVHEVILNNYPSMLQTFYHRVTWSINDPVTSYSNSHVESLAPDPSNTTGMRNVSWTIPVAWANAFPNSGRTASGVCKVSVATYTDSAYSNLVGSVQEYSFAAVNSYLTAPTIDAVTFTQKGASDNYKYQFTAPATAKYGASITGYDMEVYFNPTDMVPYETFWTPYNASSNGVILYHYQHPPIRVRIRGWDTRGTVTAWVEKTVNQSDLTYYFDPPTLNVDASRSYDGTVINLHYAITYDLTPATLYCDYAAYTRSESSVKPYINEQIYRDEGLDGDFDIWQGVRDRGFTWKRIGAFTWQDLIDGIYRDILTLNGLEALRKYRIRMRLVDGLGQIVVVEFDVESTVIERLEKYPHFIWKGISSAAMGVIIQDSPAIIRAPERTEEVNIPGRSGSLYLLEGDDVYNSYLKTVVCVATPAANMDELTSWLKGSGEVVFVPSEGNKRYFARIIDQVSIKRKLSYDPGTSGFGSDPWRDFTINFKTQPEKGQYPEEEPTTLSVSGGTMTNPGTVASKPAVTVHGSGSATLTYGGKTLTISNIPATGLVIDSDCQLVTSPDGGAILFGLVSGGFPELPCGEEGEAVNCAFTWTGGITSIDVAPRWRWL